MVNDRSVSSPAIVVTNLVKRFGKLTALNISGLEIREGELFGLLGPNGAGKTTLISILATLRTPTSGEAVVCGHDVVRDQDQVRRCMGFVFQDPSLDDELTGEENLDFHGRLYGLDARTRHARIDEVLDLVDLQDRRRDIVKVYSGGMRRRLEMARGLMHHPRVLFLDEPTLGLDPQTRRRIWTHIQDLNRDRGMTIILTTHYMDEADQLCSRIGIIDRGEIVTLGSPEELKGALGGDLLELDVVGIVPEFVRDLEAGTQVQQVYVQDGRLALSVTNGNSYIPLVFEAARNRGVSIVSVSMRKPDLEDVFLSLTGRDIRDTALVGAKERMRVYMKGMRR